MQLSSPRAPAETRQTTQDGSTWPLPRHLMTAPSAIVARMAEDIADLDSMDGVTIRQLMRLGWTERQCSQHGRAAARRVATEFRT